MRGNLAEQRRAARHGGTIPAGAGEPGGSASSGGSAWDHPRGCGGTLSQNRPVSGGRGPSPRVRGNLSSDYADMGLDGTIPAGAGEPFPSDHPRCPPRDHPRGCGGTNSLGKHTRAKAGPSPRVRGNLRPPPSEQDRYGTIPAGAGEPAGQAMEGHPLADHPRGCGGTRGAVHGGGAFWGPSPRVRGNPEL